ncbi:MAG: alpha/beta fold hydrolase [Alteromonadaceae bacterium]|nr:alpha/beta fold hydrolase [Alteromonadaceae bacterium]
MFRYVFFFSLTFLSNVAFAETTLIPTKAGLYDAGGFKLYLECYENDNPTLILEQGFGRSGSDGIWLSNILALQNDYSICLYDRSGLGKSETGEVPFTVNDAAERLVTLLGSAQIKAPYFFAGGSYAAYIVTAFNKQYPELVAGAMFFDPPPFGYFKTMATRWPENFKTDVLPLQRMYEFEQSVRNPLFERVPEKVDHLASYEQLKSDRSFGNKPVLTLFSAPSERSQEPPFVPADIAAPMNKLYDSAATQYAELSTNSEVIYSESTKHHLHIHDADLVVATIKRLKELSK